MFNRSCLSERRDVMSNDPFVSVAMKDQETFDKVIQGLENRTSNGSSILANSLKVTREKLKNQ